jgi:hypothetical protein
MSALGCVLNRSTQDFILNGKMECMIMVQKYRRGFTTAERTEMWDRWQRGEKLMAMPARLLLLSMKRTFSSLSLVHLGGSTTAYVACVCLFCAFASSE